LWYQKQKGKYYTIKIIAMKQLILFLTILVSTCYRASAQVNANPDLGYTVKDSLIEFFPTDNDVLATPVSYVASVTGAALHGTFTISATYPFKATYTPMPGYLGGDTMYYKITDPVSTVSSITAINIITENMTINNIWPGDFNHDGIVNAIDILFISTAMYQSDKAGFNRQTKWGPYFCDAWSGTQWGVNLKYIDGSGNGTIDINDVSMVSANFDKSRSNFYNINPNYNPFFANKSIVVNSKIRKKNLVLGDTMIVDLFFGDSNGLNASQRYFTAFSFGFGFDGLNRAALKNTKMWYEPAGNWITEGSTDKIEFAGKRTSEGAMEIALARTNHYYRASNPSCGLSVHITSKDKYTASSLGEIYTSVIGGTAPYTYSWSSGGSGSSISGINNSFPANNTVTVTDKNGCTVSGSVTVMNRDKSGSGSLGTVKVIIDHDIIQIVNNPTKNLDLVFTTPYAVDELIPELVNVTFGKETYKYVGISKEIKSKNGASILKSLDMIDVSLLDESESILKLELVDISGVKSSFPYQLKDKTATTSISNLADGVYIILISTEQGMYAEKFVK
jgi:hypothetical protein